MLLIPCSGIIDPRSRAPHVPSSDRSTQALILKHPLLLVMSSANLLYKVHEIQMIRDVTRREAVELIKSDPTRVLSTQPNTV